jgi:WD40 repeat protein
VLEAFRVNAAGGQRELIGARLLGDKAHVRRPWPGVRWERYGAGSERRLQGHEDILVALAECDGRVCSGSKDGSIRVWGGATLEHERSLLVEEVEDYALSLAAWEGHLISGHYSGLIRVWNVATGACDRTLDEHSDTVRCLAVSGTHLVSGSDDRSVKVWAMGAGALWPCERTLIGHADWVQSLATWRGKVLSGSDDASVCVWDVATGAHEVTLDGHEDSVRGLAVHGDRLFSASEDGTIREWALGAWAAVRTVEAYGWGGGQFPCCLVVSGSKLISGSVDAGGGDDEERCEVRVWDLGTLECEHALPQPAGADVRCLAAVCGAVWGGVGEEVVLWGRA